MITDGKYLLLTLLPIFYCFTWIQLLNGWNLRDLVAGRGLSARNLSSISPALNLWWCCWQLSVFCCCCCCCQKLGAGGGCAIQSVGWLILVDITFWLQWFLIFTILLAGIVMSEGWTVLIADKGGEVLCPPRMASASKPSISNTRWGFCKIYCSMRSTSSSVWVSLSNIKFALLPNTGSLFSQQNISGGWDELRGSIITLHCFRLLSGKLGFECAGSGYGYRVAIALLLVASSCNTWIAFRTWNAKANANNAVNRYCSSN